MADSKITPRALKLNLHDAAEAVGVSEQKILALAAEGEVIAGLIVPHWDAHAVPARDGWRCSPSKQERIDGKFTPVEWCVMEEGQPDVRVPVVTLSRFWRICAGDMVFALNGEPITIRYLLPYEALDKETAPWPETMFKLEREHTINAKDFWFVLEEAEDNPQPAAPSQKAAPEKLPIVNVLAPDREADNTLKIEPLIVPSAELDRFELMRSISEAPQPAAVQDAAPAELHWKEQARTMYLELKLQHPLQSKEQLAKKMADTGKLKGRGGKPVTAENILRNAIQNL